MSHKIKTYLSQLYDAQSAENAYSALMARIAAAQDRITPHQADMPFSERDVVLITYGNSLNQASQMPLETLAAFARRYIKGLISTIHILPFYPYSSDDGFSVKDFYAVDPQLGTWREIQALGEDFDLMFDAVFNHMSAQSEWFKAFLADDPVFQGFFRTESPDADLSMVVRPRVSPLLTPFEKASGEIVHVWTTFSADQVDLDLRHPQTLITLVDILLFYVEQGAHFIRLDAIAFLWKVVGTRSLHLEETHLIIQLMRAVLDEVAPQVVLITETNVPHRENITYWGDGYNEAQMVYNFPLPPLLLHTMITGNVRILREWVNTLETPSDKTTFFNFTASHDGIGVRPIEGILSDEALQAMIQHTLDRGGRVSYKRNPDGSQSAYELNISYVSAMIDPSAPLELQARQFLATQAIMLALAGVPAVYIHSLLGSENDLKGMEATGQNRTINRAKLDYETVQNQLGAGDTLRAHVFEGYSKLIQHRIEEPAFHPNASQKALDVGNDAVFALLRGDSVLILCNMSANPQTIITHHTGEDLLSQQHYAETITLEAYQVLWLKLTF